MDPFLDPCDINDMTWQDKCQVRSWPEPVTRSWSSGKSGPRQWPWTGQRDHKWQVKWQVRVLRRAKKCRGLKIANLYLQILEVDVCVHIGPDKHTHIYIYVWP